MKAQVKQKVYIHKCNCEIKHCTEISPDTFR
jgi:hypothetical protein